MKCLYMHVVCVYEKVKERGNSLFLSLSKNMDILFQKTHAVNGFLSLITYYYYIIIYYKEKRSEAKKMKELKIEKNKM